MPAAATATPVNPRTAASNATSKKRQRPIQHLHHSFRPPSSRPVATRFPLGDQRHSQSWIILCKKCATFSGPLDLTHVSYNHNGVSQLPDPSAGRR
jgi:hypothetical protein